MNPEMQTTLLNTYPPKLISTILKALREKLREKDHLNAVEEIAGQHQKSFLSTIKSCKEKGSGMISARRSRADRQT